MWQESRLFCYLDGFVAWICLNLNWLLAVTGVMHEADDAYSIRSTGSCYWLDQFLTLALNTFFVAFYISLDLSTIYFAHFSGCWASFVCSCHSVPEFCLMFSGVKLNIRSFILFHIYCCLFLSPLCVLFIPVYAKCNMHDTLLFLSGECFCLST